MFFAIATIAAFAAATFSATAVIFAGYLTSMNLGATVMAAAPISVAVFGITIALFSMASSLFLAGSESSSTHDRASED
ncbi:hypothetical protein SAMN05443665_101717 [Actinomadura meyerae]|uniref:Uncharacterized protein n=2 Tax=Actinomadura meyerae TaxID=240840 RepID=A0A239K7M0_9ACTN|nr:hypothetical protein SAMN05443665_101717 [Actinomadura meyerae]